MRIGQSHSTMRTTMDLDQFAKSVHETAKEKGFWDANNDHIIFYLKQLAMVHSEVSEILEAIRKEQGEAKIVEEMADVIIRLLDLYWGMRMDGALGENPPSLHVTLYQKTSTNSLRPRMHGVLA